MPTVESSPTLEAATAPVAQPTYAVDIAENTAEVTSSSCMAHFDHMPIAETELSLNALEALPARSYTYSIADRPDMPSPPSLEQGADYFKNFTAQFLDQESVKTFGPLKTTDAMVKEADFIKQAELAMSPILSPISPFLSMGNSGTPVHLDPLFSPNHSVILDEIQPPTCDEFHEAYPDLDATAFDLLEYFQSQQSHIRSVSPLKRFRAVALLFSLRSRTNLFGILSWTAWHRGNDKVAQEYFQIASEQLARNTSISKEELLVALLVLTSAKICSGNSESWPAYLTWASSLLKRHGGVSSFMETEISRWLLLHFAYLDILSVTSSTTPKLLSSKDLEFIFKRPPSPTLSESLCSCCEPLLLMIEQVNGLSKLMRTAHTTGENLEGLYNSAHMIEEQTWSLQPATEKISHLSATEQRLQILQFDAFKLVTVLHLYQSALCMNAAATPIQVLARRLLHAMDELIDSNVTGMLVFPLFVLGVNSSNASMRQQLLKYFDQVFFLIHTRSVQRVKNLLFQVWQLDQSGARHVDWTELIDQGFDFRCC